MRAPSFQTLAILFLLLLVIALFTNLGALPSIEDEARRALVAFEMQKSGNWLVPTMGGQYYYLKPPLYNWLILLSFELTGSYSEWAIRLPMILSLIGFTLTIFFVTNYFLKDKKVSFLVAACLPISARILTYESFHGLIDITYSWITFLSIVSVYYYYTKKNYWLLFLVSYALAAVAYLMKGFTAVSFQGITLVAFFVFYGQWRKLFSFYHVLGGLLFLGIVGGYYFLYTQNTGQDFSELIAVLFNESIQRTIATEKHSFWELPLHIVTFPFELINWFLPWSLLVVFFFYKDNLVRLRQQPYLNYLLIVSVANIILYWVTPEVYGRYVITFIPLFSTLCVFVYTTTSEELKVKKWIHMVFTVLAGLLAIVFLVYPIFRSVEQVSYYWPLAIFLSILIVAVVFLLISFKRNQLMLLAIALLVFRIGYSGLHMETRVYTHAPVTYKKEIQSLATHLKDEEFSVLGFTNYFMFYHLSTTTGRIVFLENGEPELGKVYITLEQRLGDYQYDYLGDCHVPFQDLRLIAARITAKK